MRIAYILTSLAMGGAERQTVGLAEWMAAHGHSVLLIVLLPRETQQWPTQLEVVHLDLRKTPASLSVSLFRARRALRNFRPELLHSHTFPANVFARILKIVAAPQVVVSTIHNVYEGGRMRMLAYRVSDFLAQRTTAVSEAVARRAIEAGAVPARKCEVIPNAFDLLAFAPNQTRRTETRSKRAAGEDFIWLAAGRIVSAKGFLNLLEAFAYVWRDWPQTQLWIAGGHTYAPSRGSKFSGLIVPKGTTGRIHQLGLRRDMPALFDAADAFVLSSAWEGMPLVVGEAMAMEKPVVATDVGGVRELLGTTGTLVPPKNAERLAEAMLNAMRQTPDARREQGRAARARIAAHFDTSERFPEWEAFYRSLLA